MRSKDELVLQSLSDQQLLESCRLLPWEERLGHFLDSIRGCGAVILIAVLITVGGHLLLRSVARNLAYLIFLIPMAFVCAAACWVFALNLAERRRKPFWKEIERRYGGADVDYYITQISKQVDLSPEILVVLCGHALPHGGSWMIRALLMSAGTATIEVRKVSPSYLSGPLKDDVKLSAGKADLSELDILQLKSRVSDLSSVGKSVHFDSTVIDGCPATISAKTKDGGVIHRAVLNLAGIPHDKAEHPTSRLVLLINTLASNVPSHPLLYGSCNQMVREVNIGTV